MVGTCCSRLFESVAEEVAGVAPDSSYHCWLGFVGFDWLEVVSSRAASLWTDRFGTGGLSWSR